MFYPQIGIFVGQPQSTLPFPGIVDPLETSFEIVDNIYGESSAQLSGIQTPGQQNYSRSLNVTETFQLVDSNDISMDFQLRAESGERHVDDPEVFQATHPSGIFETRQFKPEMDLQNSVEPDFYPHEIKLEDHHLN